MDHTTCTCTYDARDALVVVHLRGDISRSIAEIMSREAFGLGRRQDCSCFLFDWTTARIATSTRELFDFAVRQRELGLRLSDRVAIVMPAEEDQRRDHTFFEGVMRSREWYNVQCFSDEASAIAWLK